jgi:hypothetical protein
VILFNSAHDLFCLMITVHIDKTLLVVYMQMVLSVVAYTREHIKDNCVLCIVIICFGCSTAQLSAPYLSSSSELCSKVTINLLRFCFVATYCSSVFALCHYISITK